jgi:hypothetical protein
MWPRPLVLSERTGSLGQLCWNLAELVDQILDLWTWRFESPPRRSGAKRIEQRVGPLEAIERLYALLALLEMFEQLRCFRLGKLTEPKAFQPAFFGARQSWFHAGPSQ